MSQLLQNQEVLLCYIPPLLSDHTSEGLLGAYFAVAYLDVKFLYWMTYRYN